MPSELSETLPKIASHPMAIVAYVLLVGAWLLWAYSKGRSRVLVAVLELIPESERAKALSKLGFKWDELAFLRPKDRVKRLAQRDRLIVYLGLIIAILLLAIAAIAVGMRRPDVMTEREARRILREAEGTSGDGGRTEALEFLDGIRAPMQGVNLSGAILSEFTLTNNPNLTRSSMSRARVENAFILGADFTYSNFSTARLNFIEFRNCKLVACNFTDIKVNRSDFSGSSFAKSTNLSNAFFRFSSFGGANFSNVNMARAAFTNVNFANANLANISGWNEITMFSNCNLFGVLNAPDEFLKWAEQQGALKTNVTDLSRWMNLFE